MKKNEYIRKGSIAWYASRYWKPALAVGLSITVLGTAIAFAGTKDEEQLNVQEPIKTRSIIEYQTFTPIESVPLDAELQEHIFNIAEGYGLEGELILAMAGIESNYSHCAIGDEGESYGLLQVQPKWYEEEMARLNVSKEQLLDPYANVVLGVDIVAGYIERFGLEYGLIAYNEGPDDAIAKKEIGVISEYAESVLMLAELLKN